MGPWGIAAIIAVVALSTKGGRAYAKKLLRTGVKVGYDAKDEAEKLAGKAIEFKDELVSEIKAEK
jgi:hypothetical protein